MNVVERFEISFGRFTNFKRNKTETLIFAKDAKTGKEYELTCCLGVADLATDLSKEFGHRIGYSPCDFRALERDVTEEKAYDYLGKIRQDVQSDVVSAVLFEKSREMVRKIEQTASDNKINASVIDRVVRDTLKNYGDLFSDVMDDIRDEVEEMLIYSGYEVIDE